MTTSSPTSGASRFSLPRPARPPARRALDPNPAGASSDRARPALTNPFLQEHRHGAWIIEATGCGWPAVLFHGGADPAHGSR